jgi:ribokinase
MSRIVVVGGLNMDLHLFGIEESSGQAPLIAERYLAAPGGKGANVARAAARLGAEVALVGRVGDDEFGRHCVRSVSDDGVDTSGVLPTALAPTGFVAIELDEGRHRSLLFAPGANDHLTWSDVEPALSRLGAGDLVIAQAEVPAPVQAGLADFAARMSAGLYLDPTPPDNCLPELLAAAEVVTPNRIEAALLVGRADTSPLIPGLVALDLLRSGARRVVIKTAETGALLADSSGTVQIPTLAITPTDETGAGDVFLAALAVQRSEGADWLTSTRFANAASALSVAADGLMLPTRGDVDRAVHRLAASEGDGSRHQGTSLRT